MINKSSLSSTLPLWKRIAAAFSFLAVLSALIAPASMLAEEVRTCKLGGVCLANKANKAINGGESGGVTPSGTHCDSCGSLVFALPSFAAQHLPSQKVAGVALLFEVAAAISGMPPSRGPAAL